MSAMRSVTLLSKHFLAPLRARVPPRVRSSLRLGLAILHRRRLGKVTFVAITGSAGKTTAKTLTTAVLSTAGRGQQLPGTGSYFYQIMCFIPNVKPSDDFCVVEFGIYEPGCLDRSLAVVRPRIGVVTSIGMDHLKAFHSVEAIVEEKAKVIACLPEQGVAVLNADDPRVLSMGDGFPGRIITFGLAKDAALRAENVRSAWPERLSFTVVYQGNAVEVRSRLCGAHWVTAVLAALAVGISAGISLDKATKAIESVEPFYSRMQPVVSEDGVTFIMDDWKAPLWSMATVFDFLEAARVERKIIVIGTISDYGGSAGPVYSRVAKTALEVADHVIFVGPMATHGLRAKRQDNAHRLHVFPNLKSASEFLGSFLREGDFVVLKGSIISDHLGRIVHHKLDPISCWRVRCGRNLLCRDCELLRSDLQPKAPRQGNGPQARDAADPENEPFAALPRFTGPIELLVGFGNPGNSYRNTPHNVGFEVLDAMAEKFSLDWSAYDDIALAHTKLADKTILLVKPQSFVNNTGKSLKRLSDRLGLTAEDCVLIQDDIHLPLGKLRTRTRGSDGGHKGVLSALLAFQTNEFRRVKIGVAPAEKPSSAADYLLTPFAAEAAAVIDPARKAAVDRLLSMLRDM